MLFRKKKDIELFFKKKKNYEPVNIAPNLLVWEEKTCLVFHLETVITSALVICRNKCRVFLYFPLLDS